MPFEIDEPEALEQRINDATDVRIKLQETLKERQAEFEKLLGSKAAPKRPRETIEQLDKQISDLERHRETNSMSLQEEKQILREIAKIKKAKRAIEAFEVYDNQIKGTREQVTECRESLKNLRLCIGDLRSELGVAKLASQVGCPPEQLVCMKVQCPPDKLGKVIGKGGTNLKKLSAESGVNVVDIRRQRSSDDSEDGEDVTTTTAAAAVSDIRILGALDSLEKAAADLTRVIESTQVEFRLPSDLQIDYLTTKHITKINELREQHPNCWFTVRRANSTVIARGVPNDLEALKRDLTSLKIVKQHWKLPVSSALLVGRKGATIEGLVALHQAAIHIERNNTKEEEDNEENDKSDKKKDEIGNIIAVVGPQDNVSSALKAIKELSNNLREDSVTIAIESVARDALLHSGGVGIQALAKQVNEHVKQKAAAADHEAGETTTTTTSAGSTYISVNLQSDNHIVLRGRAMLLPWAKEFAQQEIAKVEANIIKIDVDPVIIPRMIGKGGEMIKQLTAGKAVTIELERTAGQVVLCGCVPQDVQVVQQKVLDLVQENQVEHVHMDASMYKIQIRDLIRTKAKELNAICNFSSNDEHCEVILRGTTEQVAEGSKMVREFLAQNHVEELSLTGDELRTLLQGGKTSKIAELQDEFNVKLQSDRERSVIMAKGETTAVQKALTALNQFLFGGEGFVVEKLDLDKEQVGKVIGAKGAQKAELVKQFDGKVSIAIDGVQNRITLRGPEVETNACRIEIVKLVATAQVTRTIPVKTKELQKLIKQNTARILMRNLPVQVIVPEIKKSDKEKKDADDETLAEIRIRGHAPDVRDAVALVKEAMTGVYESRLTLPSTQYKRVHDTCQQRDPNIPNIFDRIRKSTSASLFLDSADEAIVLKGKKAHVQAAKTEFYKLLDFILESTFMKLDLAAPLLTSNVVKTPALAEVAAVTGASLIQLDRDTCTILICGKKPETVQAAAADLKTKIAQAEALFFVVEFDEEEDWILSSVIGKKGARINKLRKATKCNFEVESSNRTITVHGESAELVQEARKVLDENIVEIKSQTVIIPLEGNNDLPAFIGRKGAHISQFSKTHSVEVKTTSLPNGKDAVRINSENPENVTAAKKDLEEWIAARALARQEAAGEETVSLRRYQIPTVIGTKGATIRSLQEQSGGCRLDMDRGEAIVRIRGGTAEKRQAVVEKIHQLLRDAASDDEGAAGPNTDDVQAGGDSPLPVARRRERANSRDSDNAATPSSKPAPKPKPQQQPHEYQAADFPVLPNNSNDEGGTPPQQQQQHDGPSWNSVVKTEATMQAQAAADAAELEQHDEQYNQMLLEFGVKPGVLPLLSPQKS